MAYIGNQAQSSFTSFDKQTITGDGTATYTLSHNVANEQEIEVFVNNVRQEPGSGKAYTVSGNQITFSENIASTDDCYVVFQGKALQTVVPPVGSVTDSMITGLSSSKLTGALPALDGSALTGISSSNITVGSTLPSSPSDGDAFYDTDTDKLNIWVNSESQWYHSANPFVPNYNITPQALSFYNGANWSNYNTYTGVDGVSRTNGHINTQAITYAGETISTSFSGDTNHVLVIKFKASSQSYCGIGMVHAPTITDAQCATDIGQYYGIQPDWTGATGATLYGGYFSQTTANPPYTHTEGYLTFYTSGSGASRTFQALYSQTYNSNFTNAGTEIVGHSGPSTGTLWTASVLPITIGTDDFSMAFGTGGSMTDYWIYSYGTYD